MKFLATLFFIILFFYLLSLLGRVMLRYWIIRKQKQFQENMEAAQRGAYGEGQRSAPEGEVRVQSTRGAKEKRVKGNVGDYVEFEEVTEVRETTEE